MSETVQTPNPLLSQLRIPGETFKIPSSGLFYDNHELSDDVNNGELYVYPMTAIDEITLKTPDKLFSGAAITDVFKNCIPQINNPLQLFSKDVDYLLVCLRMLSYGPTVEITTKHNCENAKDHSYAIELRPFISKSKSIDPTTTNQLFTVKMDNGQIVTLRPPRFGDMVALWQSMQNKNDVKDIDFEKLKETLVESVVSMIHDVSEITDKEQIKEWIRKIPVSWTYKISEAINMISDWGPDFKTSVVCKDCNKSFELQTPVNPIAFFM